MPELSALRPKPVEVTARYHEHEIKLKVVPEFYTPEVEAALADQSGQSLGVLCEFLAQSIVEWDITEGGKALPITVQSLRRMSGSLLLALANAVVSASLPNDV